MPVFLIFAEAKKSTDFGNGRFVRNMLEQAAMRWASRLLKRGSARGEPFLSHNWLDFFGTACHNQNEKHQFDIKERNPYVREAAQKTVDLQYP